MSRKKKVSQTRALKKHMRKALGVESFSDRVRRKIKSAKPAPVNIDVDPLKEDL